MNEQKNLLVHLGEAIDQYRAERRAASAEEAAPQARPGRIRRFLRWLAPNGGTLLLVAMLILTQNVWARRPAAPTTASVTTIPYQGRLADINGDPVTGQVNMEFRLYDVPTGGTPLWEEYWTGGNSVSVSDGLFSVMLGSINPTLADVVQGHDELYLGVTVGTDSEMEPRVQLGSVPFSILSLTVADGSITTDKIADGAVTGEKLDGSFMRLLGYEECDDCGNPSESMEAGWHPMKGANTQDVIEVTATTTGRPVLVQMTGRYLQNPATNTWWCGVRVLSNGSSVRFANMDGGRNLSTDAGCSGSYLFTNLPAGTYTFRAEAWIDATTTVQWVLQRQIVVYELTNDVSQ